MLTGNRVVVTGMGVLAPNGIGLEEFWRTLLAGESGIGPVTLFDASDLKCQIAGEVTGFDPHKYIDPKLKPKKRMARASQFAIAATTLALEDAGLDISDLRTFREVPVVMGVSTSAMDLFAKPPTPWTAVASVPHAVSSSIGQILGFHSKLFTISDGCASGLDAVANAANMIRNGETDIVIAGSSDSAITHYVFKGFGRSRMLSTRNDAPEKASRPFDRDRDGGIVSEGAGIFIMESLEHAISRNAKQYAEIIGFGTSTDQPGTPNGSGMKEAIRFAIADALKKPDQIDAVSCHAPSDEHMDRIEVAHIKSVLGSHARNIPVFSVKGVTGNAMAVGGVHELIASALSIKHGQIPPTANLDNPDPECDLDHVPHSFRSLSLNTVLVNTHGFGHGNSSLVLAKITESYK